MELAIYDWRDAITQFVRLIRSSSTICDANDNSAIHLLCLFYAMKSAYNVRISLEGFVNDNFGSLIDSAPVDSRDPQLVVIPEFRKVDSAALKLNDSIDSHRHANALEALQEMGVFSLCPSPQSQLISLERITQEVTDRSRIAFLVELSMFAIELGHLGRAGQYAKEARNLAPKAWHLYNICVVEGLVALEKGLVSDAVKLLRESIRACQADAHASLICGVRAPNFLLAEELLERGERLEIIEHLTDCKRIWQMPQFRFDEWINQIESGGSPKLHRSEVVTAMSRPWYTLEAQSLLVASLGHDVGDVETNSSKKSPDEVAAERKRLIEEYKRYQDGFVENKIRYLDDV